MENQTRRRRKGEDPKERRGVGKDRDEDDKLQELSKNLGKLIPNNRLGVSCIYICIQMINPVADRTVGNTQTIGKQRNLLET